MLETISNRMFLYYSLQLKNIKIQSIAIHYRYTYTLKNHWLKNKKILENLSSKDKEILENVVEKEIKWIDSNPNAKLVLLRAHLKQLKNIVEPIMEKLLPESERPRTNITLSHQYSGEL